MNRGIFGFNRPGNIDPNPLALGQNAVAGSANSLSIGKNCTGSGIYSVTIGNNNTAVTLTKGDSTTQSGSYTTPLGPVLIGSWNFTTNAAYASVAIGILNNQTGATLNTTNGAIKGLPIAQTTIGRMSSAIGIKNIASGTFSTASGYGNTGSGTSSVATGNTNTASASYSVAIGYKNSMNSASLNCVLVGRSNFGTSASFATVAFGVLNNQQSGTLNTSTGAISGTPAAAATVGRLCTAVGVLNSTSANQATALGYNNTASGANSVAIGSGSTSSGSKSVAAGYSSSASGTGCIAIGATATSSNSYSIAIGLANAANASIVLSNVSTASTGANQFIVGTITSVYFGNGVTNGSPADVSINATGGSGSNIAGAALTLAGGIGTGTGVGGSILLKVAPAGLTGSSANALSTVITVATDKSTTISGTIIYPFVSPAALSANTNNYAPTAGLNYRLTTDGSNYNITGLSIGQADGQLVTFINIHASATITIKNQDTNSTAANRFLTASGTDIALDPNGRCDLIYDNTTQRWRAF